VDKPPSPPTTAFSFNFPTSPAGREETIRTRAFVETGAAFHAANSLTKGSERGSSVCPGDATVTPFPTPRTRVIMWQFISSFQMFKKSGACDDEATKTCYPHPSLASSLDPTPAPTSCPLPFPPVLPSSTVSYVSPLAPPPFDSPPKPLNFCYLPDDLWREIASHLSLRTLLLFSRLCRRTVHIRPPFLERWLRERHGIVLREGERDGLEKRSTRALAAVRFVQGEVIACRKGMLSVAPPPPVLLPPPPAISPSHPPSFPPAPPNATNIPQAFHTDSNHPPESSLPHALPHSLRLSDLFGTAFNRGRELQSVAVTWKGMAFRSRRRLAGRRGTGEDGEEEGVKILPWRSIMGASPLKNDTIQKIDEHKTDEKWRTHEDECCQTHARPYRFHFLPPSFLFSPSPPGWITVLPTQTRPGQIKIVSTLPPAWNKRGRARKAAYILLSLDAPQLLHSRMITFCKKREGGREERREGKRRGKGWLISVDRAGDGGQGVR